MKLSDCKEQTCGTIEKLDSEGYLSQHGFFSGEKIRVLSNKKGVPMILEIRGEHLAIRKDIAKTIHLKPVKD